MDPLYESKLTTEEETVYKAVALSLSSLPVPSRISVLQKIASVHNRELVRLGAIRTAAASAAAMSRSHIGTSKIADSAARKARSENPLEKKIRIEFESQEGIKEARLKINNLKESLKNPSTDGEAVKASISDESRALRDAYCTFRDAKLSKEGKTT
jgi:hypothetical protein